MKALQNWYDEMGKGQRIFVWAVSIGLTLGGFGVMEASKIYIWGDSRITIYLDFLKIFAVLFFIPLAICIYLKLGDNKNSLDNFFKDTLEKAKATDELEKVNATKDELEKATAAKEELVKMKVADELETAKTTKDEPEKKTAKNELFLDEWDRLK